MTYGNQIITDNSNKDNDMLWRSLASVQSKIEFILAIKSSHVDQTKPNT